MAAGATPEQAMAEAAEAGGFLNPAAAADFGNIAESASGPMDSPMNAPLGNMGMPMPEV